MPSRPRYPEVKYGPDGKARCRGCGGEIPKGRYTWCSQECYDLHEPTRVKHLVWERSGGRCEWCGYDFKVEEKKYNDAYWEKYRARPMYSTYPIDVEKPRAREYDHIVPHSEGGEYSLENIRLLCSECHKKRTREWHREKTIERKNQLVLIRVN